MHVVAMGEDSTVRVLASTQGGAAPNPVLSPNGEWLAFTSQEAGRLEVFVRSISGDAQRRVSDGGGRQPIWSRDGATLYYRDNDGRIIGAAMAATSSPDGKPSMRIGPKHGFGGTRVTFATAANYLLMPDGKHMAVLMPAGDEAEISVVVNWIQEINKLLPPRTLLSHQ